MENAPENPYYHSDMDQTEPPETTFVQGMKAESYPVDLLLMVVTEVELVSVLRHLKPLPNQTKVLRGRPVREMYFVGVYGIYPAAVVQCTSMGPTASQEAATAAISFWKPKATIMVGIAFGLFPNKQHLGDVLVSQQLACYDLQKISGDAQKIIPRGPIVQGGVDLAPLFISGGTMYWKFLNKNGVRAKVYCGQILSGSILVSSKTFAQDLSEQYPNAVGGEMEGVGVMTAATSAHSQWMIVKGICDFAGLAGDKNDTAQAFAAAAAASLVHHVLNEPNLEGLKCRTVENNGDAPQAAVVPAVAAIPAVAATLAELPVGAEKFRVVAALQQESLFRSLVPFFNSVVTCMPTILLNVVVHTTITAKFKESPTSGVSELMAAITGQGMSLWIEFFKARDKNSLFELRRLFVRDTELAGLKA